MKGTKIQLTPDMVSAKAFEYYSNSTVTIEDDGHGMYLVDAFILEPDLKSVSDYLECCAEMESEES